MKKNLLIVALFIIIGLLSVLVFISYKNDKKYSYFFKGNSLKNDISINYTLYVDGKYIDYNITTSDNNLFKGSRLYYLENGLKRTLLGGSTLFNYFYSGDKSDDKAIGEVIRNIKELYLDVCTDEYCSDVYTTIKVK